VLGVYAAITAVLFRNLLPDLSTHLYSDLGDPLLNTAILAWNARHLPLTPEWWDFPSFAPLSGVTAFTEHLLLTYPVASPIIWLTGNAVLAYNVLFLVAMPLNGIAAFALGRELTGSNAAAFIAGLAFAFAPYQSVHLSHVQLMLSFGMPLSLLGLHRYLRTGRRSALVWFGVGWFCALLANSALLFFFPLLVLLIVIWFVRAREWRRLIAPAVVAVLGTLPLVPLLWGYYVRQRAYGFTRVLNEIQSFSADLVGLAGMYYRSSAWRGLLPHDFEEGALFPGLTIFMLVLVALFTCGAGGKRTSVERRWPRRLFRASAVLTVVVLARIWTGPWGWHIGPLPLPPFQPYQLFTVAVVLCVGGLLLTRAFRDAWQRRDTVVFYAVALGFLWFVALGPQPEWSTPWRAIAAGPYRLLMELPGLRTIRVPARAWLPAVLCLAMLAGFGAAWLFQRFAHRRRALVTALAVLIVCEGWFGDRTQAVPRPMRAGAIPAGALVLDLPVEEGLANAIPQYRAVMGGYRTVNGFSGYEPPHFNPLRHAIADVVPHALDAYRRLADLYVVLHPGLDAIGRWIATTPGADHLFDLGDASVYRLPRLESATRRTVPLPLPRLGDRPFGMD
jgi:hypothetical protein